ncbi:MAG: epoxyqueuosine reductase [Verrucomicrobiales bacterium]|jgi:epoxyqueuosine reductase
MPRRLRCLIRHSLVTDEQKKAVVQKAATELGFSECRIARCEPAAHKEAFRKWLADGCHGEMEWMERTPERREDPQRVMSGAKTMVVLALNYWQGDAAPDFSPSQNAAHGVIARYARGDDYHMIIEDRLGDLCSVLEDLGGTQQRGYVDYGPVLERDFATASGIGWNGKSTVQIHPKLGTWFFLAEVITTLQLPADTPSKDHCGKCTRCIDACPTNAITGTRHVDARRCISYLTIENPGSIPVEFREAIGARIFGCDDCLAICPWNRFAQTARDAARFTRPQVHRMPLREFLTLTEEDFRHLFRQSPIKRIKRHRFLRNVCVALGNVGTSDDLPALRNASSAPEPLIAEHAQWAIDQIALRQNDHCQP